RRPCACSKPSRAATSARWTGRAERRRSARPKTFRRRPASRGSFRSVRLDLRASRRYLRGRSSRQERKGDMSCNGIETDKLKVIFPAGVREGEARARIQCVDARLTVVGIASERGSLAVTVRLPDNDLDRWQVIFLQREQNGVALDLVRAGGDRG